MSLIRTFMLDSKYVNYASGFHLMKPKDRKQDQDSILSNRRQAADWGAFCSSLVVALRSWPRLFWAVPIFPPRPAHRRYHAQCSMPRPLIRPVSNQLQLKVLIVAALWKTYTYRGGHSALAAPPHRRAATLLLFRFSGHPSAAIGGRFGKLFLSGSRPLNQTCIKPRFVRGLRADITVPLYASTEDPIFCTRAALLRAK